MAQTLTPFGRRLLVSALGLAGLPAAFALGPSAPFEPPRAASSAMQAAAAASAASGAEAAPSGLAGVRLGRKPGALIDDQWVEIGATVRGARLAAVRDGEAQLLHPDGQIERLRLTPDVELLHARIARRDDAPLPPLKKAPKP